MRSRDALYRALRAQRGSWYETQILRGPAVYGDNVAEPYAKGIHSLELELALFDDDGPQIGIARAAKCRMEIEETKDNWPRGASFIIRTRLHDEACTQASGWMSLGVFFTDQRKPDPFGTLTITAYDGMLLLEQSWTDKAELPSQWPITAAAAAALLEEATGVELENPELLDDTTPFIGLNTTSTAREVWSDIAAALGCNLQMTSEGRLRLIPFAALPDGYRGAVADLAIADVAIVDTTGGEPSGEYAPLGLDVTTVGTGSSLPAITGVELRTETGAVARAGDTSGYVLKGVCNFSDSAAAALCLSRVRGLAYRPFDCTDAYIDPAFEPGELVELNGVIYQIMVMEWTLCAKPTADLSAPYEEELEHEYAVQTSAGRALRIAISESRRESAEQLQTFITGSYAADLSAIRGQIDGKAETWYQAGDPAADWTDAQKTEHTGDLWYRTGDGVTLRYSGSAWVQMDVPDAVFDKIDGKAQIFTAQPAPPYNVGDLWFGGAGADIMTCVRARSTGSYTASDWQKYNKYTDDTAANAVAEDLDENYMTATDTQSAIEQTALSIRQNVASTYVSNVKLAEQLSGYSPTNAIDAKFSTKAEAKASADALKSEIKLTDDTLTLAFSQLRADTDAAVNAMSYYIRYKDGVVIIGKTDSPTSIRISNQQIALYYGEDVISYWNQERQYTPKALQIPQGGSFTLGSTLFQPRSSGNLSFMWVGD